MKNLVKLYLPLYDSALILDNSLAENKVNATKSRLTNLIIEEPKIWKEIEEVASGQ